MQWREKAACIDTAPEVFFPSGDTMDAEELIKNAQKICNTCVATEECALWSIDNHIDAGIWGGLSEHDRRVIRRIVRKNKDLDAKKIISDYRKKIYATN